MMRAIVHALATIVAVAACSGDPGPPLEASDVRIFAPLPGSPAGVAYMVLTNTGSAPVAIHQVTSPQFDRVEIHETTIDGDGVSRMQRLQQVQIAALDSVRFEEGSLHLMLLGPRTAISAGTPVMLEVEHSAGILIVNATLQNRLSGR